MAPKAGSARKEARATGTRASRRHNPDASVETMRDDPEQVLRNSRRTARSRAGRGGRRGGLAPTRSSHSAPDPSPEDATADQVSGPADTTASPPAEGTIAPTQGQPPQTDSQEPPTPTEGSYSVDRDSDKPGSQGVSGNAPTGEKDSNGKGSEPNEDGKRGPSTDDDENEPSKKAKTDEGDQSGQQHQDQSGGTSQRDSCVLLRESLERLRREAPAPGRGTPFRDPVTRGANMEDHNVYRAIASVTEAVTQGGHHTYTVMGPFTLQSRQRTTFARPLNEVMIPWCPGRHISLFVLRREPAVAGSGGSDRFRMSHFDSGTNGHRNQLNQYYHDIRESLLAAGWGGRDGALAANTITGCAPHAAAGQRSRWTCGLHTIFNAWASALDLEVSDHIDMDRYHSFIENGMEIINLATRGYVDSNTIWAFFNCYGFTTPNSQVGVGRAFERTAAFPNIDSLTEHVGLLRLIEDLRAMREHHAVPDALDEVEGLRAWLASVAEFTGAQPDLTTLTAEDFVRNVRAAQSALEGQQGGGHGLDSPDSGRNEPPVDSQQATESGSGAAAQGTSATEPTADASQAPTPDQAGAETQGSGDTNTGTAGPSTANEEVSSGPAATTTLIENLRANGMLPGTPEYEARQAELARVGHYRAFPDILDLDDEAPLPPGTPPTGPQLTPVSTTTDTQAAGAAAGPITTGQDDDELNALFDGNFDPTDAYSPAVDDSEGFDDDGPDMATIFRNESAAVTGNDISEEAPSPPLTDEEELARLEAQYNRELEHLRSLTGNDTGADAPAPPLTAREQLRMEEDEYRRRQGPDMSDRLNPYTDINYPPGYTAADYTQDFPGLLGGAPEAGDVNAPTSDPDGALGEQDDVSGQSADGEQPYGGISAPGRRSGGLDYDDIIR